MDFSIFINWISPFSIWVQLGDIYPFFKKKKKKKIDRAVWKRSVETLIRCHTPQCLIWVCSAFLSSADVFILLYFFFVFFENIFFQEEIKIKKKSNSFNPLQTRYYLSSLIWVQTVCWCYKLAIITVRMPLISVKQFWLRSGPTSYWAQFWSKSILFARNSNQQMTMTGKKYHKGNMK